MESLWRKQTKIFSEEAKPENNISQNMDKQFDVIVIGAGMAGLLIAYYLKEQGKRVLVLEANTIASGQTERTTAKITSQHGLKYSKLVKEIGKEKARLYARANEAAIREYEKLIQKEKIECQFEKVPAYLYSEQEEEQLQEEAKTATMLGIDAFFTKETELPFSVKGAVCFQNQAQFSPLEFVRGIISDLEIWEGVKVTAVKGNQVEAENLKITADKIVIATHYPILNVPGFYFLRQHQERSYVLALSGCPPMKGMYYGIDKNSLSFRQAKEYLLLGGGGHRTGENICGGKYKMLFEAAEQYYPESQKEAYWSAQDCMPHDKIPFIGKYSVFTPNLYVATGFQKWGMTSSMIAAMILRDELNGISNPYTELFTPQRIHLLAAMPALCHDIGISVKGLAKGWLFLPQKRKAPFRCPHMGCELTWNPDEESWDCPCHGSRFDADGKWLDNPTKKDVVVKEP